jgi:hypothetical protein
MSILGVIDEKYRCFMAKIVILAVERKIQDRFLDSELITHCE